MAKLLSHILPPPASDDELQEIVNQIESAELLLNQGLLRVSELVSLTQTASDAYENTADHNSIQYRKYDKARRSSTIWRPERVSGYAEPEDGAHLLQIKQQIIELLDLHLSGPQATELFLPPNSQHTARHYIRNILSSSATSIEIKDEYLFSANQTTKNIDILWLLQPYLSTSLDLSMKLLGSPQNPPKWVASDIKAFLSQNPKVAIKGNSISETGKSEAHDRFIIIDQKDVYKIGASIKDLGVAQSSIDKVNNPEIAQQYIEQFNSWWLIGNAYTSL